MIYPSQSLHRSQPRAFPRQCRQSEYGGRSSTPDGGHQPIEKHSRPTQLFVRCRDCHRSQLLQVVRQSTAHERLCSRFLGPRKDVVRIPANMARDPAKDVLLENANPPVSPFSSVVNDQPEPTPRDESTVGGQEDVSVLPECQTERKSVHHLQGQSAT